MNATQSPEGPPSTGFFRSGTGRWIVAAAVSLVVILVVALLLVRGGSDDDGDQAAGTSGTSPSEKADATPGTGTKSPGTGSASTKPGKGKGSSSGQDEQVTTKKPQRVTFDQTATPTPGVDLKIADVESVNGKAEITGEVGGPALRITLEVTNTTEKPVAINTAVTNLYYGRDRTPASTIMRPGYKPLPQSVKPGKTVTGKINFTVAKKNRSRLLLEVNLDNQFRTVEFNGSCPRDC